MSKPKTTAAALIEITRGVTQKWAKQRKAEERHSAARSNRVYRMLHRREKSIKDIAHEVMEQAYLKASAGGEYPTLVRQVMYQARPLIQAQTDKRLNDQYFCQTLLPDYLEATGVEWDIVFDDRGHFTEPHTRHQVGLGTISVRKYLTQIAPPALRGPRLASAAIATVGPHGGFGGVLFIEKEGFQPLFQAVHLAERFDLAIMSTKGVSNTAARTLIDQMCGKANIPLFVLHDFDKSGFSILGTLRRATRRYTFDNRIKVIDLGLRLDDISKLGLEAEKAFDRGQRSKRAANLRMNGASEAEVKFLLDQRVELNALPSDQLIAFIERKLKQHGVRKIVPSKKDLADAYRLLVRGKHIEKAVAKALKQEDTARISVPADLERRVQQALKAKPTLRWTGALADIVAKMARASP